MVTDDIMFLAKTSTSLHCELNPVTVAAPPTDKKEASLPSLSGVAVPTQDPGNPLAPEAQTAVEEAVHKVQDNKEILGEIVNFSSSC